MAKISFERLRNHYPNAVKVFITADEFFAWCYLRAHANNSEARAQFTADKLRATLPPMTANEQ